MNIILRNKLKFGIKRLVLSVKLRKSAATLIWATATLLISGGATQVSAAGLPAPAPIDSDSNTAYAVVSTSNPFNMDLGITPTGNAEKHITCYPNPAISYINFKFDKSVPKDATLFVFSFTGKKMEELAITGQILKITLDKYYRGLYVYQLRSAGGAILESGKFQVKH